MLEKGLNNRGSVLALVLMVMVTIMIIGIAAMHDTEIEGRVSRNHAIFKTNFYAADAAFRQAVHILDNTANPNSTLVPGTGCLSIIRKQTSDTYDPIDDLHNNGINSTGVPSSQMMVVYGGIAPESELGLEEDTHLYAYSVYARGFYSLGSETSDAVIAGDFRRRF